MAPEFVALTLVATGIVTALAMLSLGGWLIRNDRNHGATRLIARLIEDLRWVQDVVVEFFRHARPCTQLLSILTTRQTPVMAKELMQKIGADIQPLTVEWAALGIMRLGGLVRFTGDGVLATDVGREVQLRIIAAAETRSEREFRRPSVYDSLFVPIPVDTSASSQLQRVREASREKPLGFVQRKHAASLTGIGQLRTAFGAGNTSAESPNKTMETTSMNKRTIIMTAADHEELTYAIAAAGKLSERGRSETNALETEIARAKIVDASGLPPDVITMNSRAELLDLETGERMEFTLVFPVDANIEEGKISVLAPLGTAMLGYRVNDEFRWTVPYGVRRLKVTAVRFQPEAAFAMAA